MTMSSHVGGSVDVDRYGMTIDAKRTAVGIDNSLTYYLLLYYCRVVGVLLTHVYW